MMHGFALPASSELADERVRRAASTVARAWQLDVRGVSGEPDDWLRSVRPGEALFVKGEGHVGHPHVLGESPLETLLRRSTVPVWAHVGPVDVPSSLTLAFHGQRKAYHAAELAAHLARAHDLPVDVLVVREANEDEVDEGDVQLAREELLVRHVRTREVFLESGDPAAVLAGHAHPGALLVMGSYGDGSLLGFKLGRTVDAALRAARGPLLLCP